MTPKPLGSARLMEWMLDMQYTLITNAGRVYTFYIKAAAECYQQAYGGVLVTNEVINESAQMEIV